MSTMGSRLLLLTLTLASVVNAAPDQYTNIGSNGVSATWIFANIAYTGMRAQANPSFFWSVVSFIAGFPGTLLMFLIVKRWERTRLRNRYAAKAPLNTMTRQGIQAN